MGIAADTGLLQLKGVTYPVTEAFPQWPPSDCEGGHRSRLFQRQLSKLFSLTCQ